MPVSTAARTVNTVVITPLRLGFILLLVGTTLEVLTTTARAQSRARRWRRTVHDHTVVIGYGTKGRAAAYALRDGGASFDQMIVIDPDPSCIAQATEDGLAGLVGDATLIRVLEQAEVGRATRVMIATQRDDTSVLACLTVRRLNPRATVVVAIRQAENEELTRTAGADSVVVYADTAGRLLGVSALSPATGHVATDLLSAGSGLELVEREATAADVGTRGPATPEIPAGHPAGRAAAQIRRRGAVGGAARRPAGHGAPCRGRRAARVSPGSQITLRFLAAPTDVESIDGTVGGGKALEWIDKAAYALSVMWCGGNAVTAYVGDVHFRKPIESGHLVEVSASLVHTGRSSMHIRVVVSSVDPKGGQPVEATDCLVIFVAVDADGSPMPVPAWGPGTDEQRARQADAIGRIAVRARIEAAMSQQTYTEDTTAQRVTLRFQAKPTDVNWSGKTHGGNVMRWIDEAAHVCCMGWTGGEAIAVYSGGIRFYRPIQIGDIVEVEARLLYTGRSSMHVSVCTFAPGTRASRSCA